MVRDLKKGEDVFYSQHDPGDSWTDAPYWEGTFADNGCGLVSLAMCCELLTGKTLDPLMAYNMRKEAGLDQTRTFEKGGSSICGGDVHPQLNEVNGRLFGVKSLLLERSVDAFREALQRPDTVIWTSFRNYVAHNKAGEPRVREKDMGHVVVIWKYEDGIFYIKDCSYLKDMGNNIPYTEDEMQAFVGSSRYQQYAITLARSEAGMDE